ncbi:MAG: hypothetical protein JSW49_01965 [candidate division WOR-3 bacterium]|nr:MAG: hypothetical protein JSW49_01965 [candidate division WOR-3 bacterium]
MKYLLCFLLIITTASANGLEEYLADRILSINEELLQSYIQPLINAFGTGVSSGLFHSAYSHDFLGFDIGVRFMSIHIPEAAKYYDGIALICSLALDSLVYYEVPLESVSTVFGPNQEITIPVQGYAVSIPSTMPTGFELSSAPLIMPQINIGLAFGAELAIRYVPFTFEGTRMNFIGIGAKQELNRFPLFKAIPLPVGVAIGAAYQRFDIENRDRMVIAKTSTWNVQTIVSKRIGPLEPMLAIGVERTKAYFNYVFEYEIPDTTSGIPYERITVQQEVSLHLESQSRYRAIAGCTLRLGSFFIHYDYNFTPYSTHNVSIGIGFR